MIEYDYEERDEHMEDCQFYEIEKVMRLKESLQKVFDNWYNNLTTAEKDLYCENREEITEELIEDYM